MSAYAFMICFVDADGWHDSGNGSGTGAAEAIDWLTISDQAKSVYEDVQRIRKHPLVATDIPIYGYLFDAKNRTVD